MDFDKNLKRGLSKKLEFNTNSAFKSFPKT